MTKTVHFFRHGQTEWNIKGKIQGSTDVPLTPGGVMQAKCLLKFVTVNSIEDLYSSPLKRAYNTALLASANTGIEVKVDSGLSELHMGKYEGMQIRDIIKRHGADCFSEMLESNGNENIRLIFPEGESAKDGFKRFSASVDNIVKRSSGNVIGIFSHGIVISLFLNFSGINMPTLGNGDVVSLKCELKQKHLRWTYKNYTKNTLS